VIGAVMAVATKFDRRTALAASNIVASLNHFFIFTRRVKLIVRFASFSNP